MKKVSRKGFLQWCSGGLVAIGVTRWVEPSEPEKFVPPPTDSVVDDGLVKFHEQPYPPMALGEVRFVKYNDIDLGRQMIRVDLLTDLSGGHIFTAVSEVYRWNTPEEIQSAANQMEISVIKAAAAAGYEANERRVRPKYIVNKLHPKV